MYLLPDIKYRPLGSTAKLVTASRWATIEWISLPLEKEIVILYEYLSTNICQLLCYTGFSSNVSTLSVYLLHQ